MSERFITQGLEFQRLGQGRIELSAGAGGTLDTLTVGGVDLLPGGAVPFNTSLLQTAIDIADAINVNTDTHGFEAIAGTPDTNAEFIFYQVIPGLLGDSAVVFGITTMTGDYIRPTGFADNELFGDTDDFVVLPLETALAADDFAVRGLLRIATGTVSHQPREILAEGGSPCVFQSLGTTSGGVTRFKLANTQTGAVSTKPEGFKMFTTTPKELPVANWQKGEWRGIVHCDIDAVFSPEYALFV